MPLSAGDKFGPYVILAPIGAGGMGEVYRARDTRLEREAAIKVLPTDMALDRDRLLRFEREAKVLASLNHPNIAHVYGLEECGETRALAMELVPGVTLKGPLPIETALSYARQIAEALEAAHEKGITHRDLKPANLMITPDGVVKVLDFGLASVPNREPDRSDPADSPTMTMDATHVGAIMGTAAYMSPEQAAGKPVDRRADIWSFGVVLYEMLTGTRLFTGETISHTLADVLRGPIDLDKLPPETPHVIRDLLRRCLVRDARKRLRDIGDARIAIDESLSESQRYVPKPARVAPLWLARLLVGMAAALAVALACLAFIHFREKPPETRLLTLAILPPDNTSGVDFRGAISPDGKRVVFGARSGNKTQLWVRSLESDSAQPIAGTEDGTSPFWSPDSHSIAFFANEKLKRIDLPAEGSPLTLADTGFGLGGSWNTQGIILFASLNKGLKRIPATGGTPETVALGGTQLPVFPSFLPDGRHFLFTALREYSAPDGVLRLASLDSGETKALGTANRFGLYTNGRLLVLRGDTLVSQGFDERRMEAAQEALPVAHNVSWFDASRDGVLIYRTGNFSAQQLTWFDRSGTRTGIVGDPANLYTIEFSPDRKKIAVSWDDDVWIYDVARGLRSRFTYTPGVDTNPVWFPDGSSIAFCSNRSGVYAIYRKSSAFTGGEDLLYSDSIDTLTDSWSPDGKFVMVHRRDPKTQEDLDVLPVTPNIGAPLKLSTFIKTPFRELHGRFSPDGRWVAYVSNESQRTEIYVAPFPGPGGKQQISASGGTQPRWRGDGTEIYYAAQDGTLTAVEVSTKGNVVEVGAVHSLGIPVVRGRGWLYDVSSDGQHFLVAVPTQQKSAGLITLVYNWPLMLKK
jgi:eukaryotic-like serine/threonine-protein kinase